VKPGCKIVIVGGAAAGQRTASELRRLDPDAEITLIERGGCLPCARRGLPYYVGGAVQEHNELACTSEEGLLGRELFEALKDIHVLALTTATTIDRANRRVKAESAQGARWLDYDVLVLATGSEPIVPPIPGVELEGVFALHRVGDAERIHAALDGCAPKNVVILGGALLGAEMLAALVERGARVAMVDVLPQMLPMLDWEMARLVQHQVERHGVSVLLGNPVEAFVGDGRVEGARVGGREIPCDVALVAVGLRPNVRLGRAAGVDIGESGAIRVDPSMRTNHPRVFAAGECVEARHIVSGRPVAVADAATAAQQGRIAAVNICGGGERYPGIVGTAAGKVFDYAVARTGLTEAQARKLGYDLVSSLAPLPDKPRYHPEAKLLVTKVVVERATRRLLGVQAVGPGDASKRVAIAAVALAAGMTVDQVADLDLAFAPPLSAALDNIIVAANAVRDKLDGRLRGITPVQLKQRLDAGDDLFLLDAPSRDERHPLRLPNSTQIPLDQLTRRLDEVPRHKTIVAFSKMSVGGCEAARILGANGWTDVLVLDGGSVGWPFEMMAEAP
jgi:NADPH-dependent 2,4-dienoyl-CoA reductase/sulfur reductase-like enzyme/rhodanese-related sulfurtransferase